MEWSFISKASVGKSTRLPILAREYLQGEEEGEEEGGRMGGRERWVGRKGRGERQKGREGTHERKASRGCESRAVRGKNNGPLIHSVKMVLVRG